MFNSIGRCAILETDRQSHILAIPVSHHSLYLIGQESLSTDELFGSKTLTLTAYLNEGPSGQLPRLFPCSLDDRSYCPLDIQASLKVSFHLSICLPVCLSVYLSVCLSEIV